MFTKDNYRSNLYETSLSNEDYEHSGSVLTQKEGESVSVYNFDKVKKEFCKEYRKNELSSCDAYFANQYEHIVIEFKNTNHTKLLGYMDDIKEKLIDTHMLLLETFLQGKKASFLKKNVKLLVVYNDNLNYGEGVQSLNKCLCTTQPKKGSRERTTKPIEDTYKASVDELKNLFEIKLYSAVEFIDKSDFMEYYVKTDVFEGLA